ncbi:MAG: hypothetical protein V4547_16365 [Bacteroidota bacterium]
MITEQNEDLPEGHVVTEQMAVDSMKQIIEKWDEKVKDDEQVRELYPDVLLAIQTGIFEIDENLKSTYKLQVPVLNDKGEESYTKVIFRTRIKPSELAKVTKGINVQKEQFQYLLNVLSFITQLPIPIIDKLSKKDYRVLDQISTIFS